VGLLVLVTGGFQTAPAVSRRGLLWSSPGLRPAPPGCAIFRALSLGQAAEVAPSRRSVVLVALLGVLFLSEQLTARA
jgi:uncharacterized membrane protein